MSPNQIRHTTIRRPLLFGACGAAMVVCGLAVAFWVNEITEPPPANAEAGPIVSSHSRPAISTQTGLARKRSPVEIDPAESRRRECLWEIEMLPAEAAESEYCRITDLLLQCGEGELLNSVLQSIPDRGLRENFLQRVSVRLAKDNPARTAAWLLQLEIDADRTSAFSDVAREWGRTAPEAATTFALNLPEGELRREALTAAVLAWVEKDRDAAAVWVGHLESKADFDPVVAQIVNSPAFVEADLTLALNWAGSIVDENLRSQSLSNVVNAWAERDRAGALEYLQTCPALTSFQRETLLENLALP
ncbi:MAG: hypothetical protein H7Y43_01160 [Akkermansiaceae bacterium]|nr:hypothetical protein [Verrucomicrobiales bacterium]